MKNQEKELVSTQEEKHKWVPGRKTREKIKKKGLVSTQGNFWVPTRENERKIENVIPNKEKSKIKIEKEKEK